MKASISNIQHGDNTYTIELWGDGQTQIATVKKDNAKVAERRFKKDDDIAIDLGHSGSDRMLRNLRPICVFQATELK